MPRLFVSLVVACFGSQTLLPTGEKGVAKFLFNEKLCLVPFPAQKSKMKGANMLLPLFSAMIDFLITDGTDES